MAETIRPLPLYAHSVAITNLGQVQMLTFSGPSFDPSGSALVPVCNVVIPRELALRLTEISKAAVNSAVTAAADTTKPQ